MAPSSAKKPVQNTTLLSFFAKSKEKPIPPAAKVPISSPASVRTSALSSSVTATPQVACVEPSLVESHNLNTPVSQSVAVPDGLSVRQEPASSPLTRRRRLVVDSDSEGDAESDQDSDSDFSPSNEVVDGSREKATEFKTVGQARPSLHTPAESLAKFNAASKYSPRKSLAKSSPPPRKKLHTAGPDEERYKWLLDVRDADGHRPDDPDYDPRTLYVPPSAWAKFTPFEKQYWEVKQRLWNTVVFFKKGKFYELYENDAAIAHSQFDLKLAGGGRANMSLCGVPEMSFDYWASAFIAKGYKVARVDQSETALGKEMRDSTAGKKEEKVIRRELSCVLTAGTLTESSMLTSDLPQFCMAVTQNGNDFGVTFVDTATGAFYMSEFCDSPDFAQLETLIAQTRPREIVVERGNLDRAAAKIIRTNTNTDTLWEILKPTEFGDSSSALDMLVVSGYFPSGDNDDRSQWPPVLRDEITRSSLKLSLKALGGLLWYLRSLKLDEQLVSIGQFNLYKACTPGSSVVIDGQTLQNLEVFANTWDGGSDGTLFKFVNKCATSFGKRRLRAWVAHPLATIDQIKERADAVDLLIIHDEFRSRIEEYLSGLPDTERMLSRVHAGVLRPREFVKLVRGLEKMIELLAWLQENDVGVPLFSRVANVKHTDISRWMSSFDHDLASSSDILVPEIGVEADFDESKAQIAGIERELEELLSTYRQMFKSQTPVYRDSGKEIYLVELPTKIAQQVPHDWQQMGATAKAKRFYPPEVKTLVRRLQEAKETHKSIAAGVQQRLYARFSADYLAWLDVTRAVASIDCLVSLARTAAQMPVNCRPEFIDSSETKIAFNELRHPCASSDFVPNNITLGGGGARISLLTGANAAGKSTVLRMTGCAVLLAQLGARVPAASAVLTPVDRIMTRLGASDNIFAGKSTFHVELSETKRILSEATPRSLVVLDELGRGGSSADGLAIAEAVLHHLSTHIGCLGFFATHYGTLVPAFRTHPGVKPERMAVDIHRESREVVFLYQLEAGQSEGSFGMNVAAMCGIAPEIVDAADAAAREFMSLRPSRGNSDENALRAPLGLVSDVVEALRHEPEPLAVQVMREMALQLL